MWFKPARLGEAYRTTRDIKTLGLTIHKAPGSGGFYCIIPKDTIVVITNEPLPWPISKAAYGTPLNYKELENKIVPLEERELPTYYMYALSLEFKDLKKYFVREYIDIKDIKFDDEKMQAYFDERIREKKR